MIKPELGRCVHFLPTINPEAGTPEKIHTATICYVHSDRMVNLAVTDENGTHYSATSVALLQEADEIPCNGYYAKWPPHLRRQEATPATDEAATTTSSGSGQPNVEETPPPPPPPPAE